MLGKKTNLERETQRKKGGNQKEIKIIRDDTLEKG